MEIKIGIYKHFKTGNLYRVIGGGKHSETLEDLVFYEALYDNPVSKLWVRPISMFSDEKISPENGEKVKRFEFIKE
jgi:hypothetical protein